MKTDLLDSHIERVTMLESVMTGAATDGSSSDNRIYEHLRRDFMLDDELNNLLPPFVRSHRSLSTFRSWTQKQSPHWQPRRDRIAEGFRPFFDYLEGKGRCSRRHSSL